MVRARDMPFDQALNRLNGSEPGVLYIFAGLPGSGKTTLAEGLAQRIKACYLRIDTIEQALRDLCALNVHAEGYALAYRLAADNLRVGTSVVADSCNPVAATRRAWEQVALGVGAPFVNIEVMCSDRDEHRRRVTARRATVSGLKTPTWAEVERREYHDWTQERVLIDTFDKSVVSSVDELLAMFSQRAQHELKTRAPR